MLTPLSTQLAELEAVDTSTLAGSGLVAHVGKLEQLRSQLTAVTIDAVGTLERAQAYEVDGSRTAATWLTAHCGTSKGDARGQVRLAVHLRWMPATKAAFAAGQITEAHARVLARGVANERTVADFAWDESMLVALAKKVTADQLAQEMRRWLDLHDPDGTAPDDPANDVVHANQVGERVKIDADLGLETGLPILAALNERVDVLHERDKKVAEENPEDPLRVRTPGNRRAEALWEDIDPRPTPRRDAATAQPTTPNPTDTGSPPHHAGAPSRARRAVGRSDGAIDTGRARSPAPVATPALPERESSRGSGCRAGVQRDDGEGEEGRTYVERGADWTMHAENELLALERAAWDALSTDGDAAAAFYERRLATRNVLMLLPGGMVLDDRDTVIDSMRGAPWSTRH